MKEENDKLLEQLKKQEKDADVAIISYGMSPPAVEGCSQYENLKLSSYRWVAKMEEMDKACYTMSCDSCRHSQPELDILVGGGEAYM